MPVIQISILPDMIPVDEYDDDDNGNSCPLPTRDEELNAENREVAIETANYRDPADGGAFRVTDVCGNCKAYNQTEEILDCIGDNSGEVGYCQIHKFLCSDDWTCDDWVEGGPMTGKAQQSYGDVL